MIVIGLFRGLLVLHVCITWVVGNPAKCADVSKGFLSSKVRKQNGGTLNENKPFTKRVSEVRI